VLPRGKSGQEHHERARSEREDANALTHVQLLSNLPGRPCGSELNRADLIDRDEQAPYEAGPPISPLHS
jgi:hypothetical protein